MFIKSSENKWINLNMCKQVDIRQIDEKEYNIVFLFVNVGPDAELNSSIGPFDTEIEAQELLDIIWSAYKEKQTIWTQEPKLIFKVTIQDTEQVTDFSKWSDDTYSPLEVFLDAILRLNIEKVTDLDLSIDGVPFITRYRDPRRAQRKWRDYYITSGLSLLTMKDVLHEIGDKLNQEIIVDISYFG